MNASRFLPQFLLPVLLLAASPALGGSVITNPFTGITRIDRTETLPRAENMHIIEVDLTAPGIGFAVTAPGGTRDTLCQTTLNYLNQEQAQVAINTNFWMPFPTPDGNANLVGLSASAGAIVSPFEPQPIAVGTGYTDQSYAILPYAPGLNIDAANQAAIVHRDAAYADNQHVLEPVTLYNAVAGCAQIITNGAMTIPTYTGTANGGLNPLNGYSDSNSWYNLLKSQTVIGLSQDNQTLVLFTVDIAGGSAGMKASEVANLLINDYGVYNAIEMDNGGSTSLAMQDPATGNRNWVNHPSDTYPTGRSVGSSLAVFAQPIPEPATVALLAAGLGALAVRARKRRQLRQSISTKGIAMHAPSHLRHPLIVIATALALSGAGLAQADTVPYSQDFSGANGSTPAGWTTYQYDHETGWTDTWAVQNGSFHHDVSRPAGKSKGYDMSSVPLTFPGTTAGRTFDMSALLNVVADSVNSINATFGFRFLAASATGSNTPGSNGYQAVEGNSLMADFNLNVLQKPASGDMNSGKVRFVWWNSGGTAPAVLPSGTFSLQPGLSHGLVTDTQNQLLDTHYQLALHGQYSGDGSALTCTFTVTDLDYAGPGANVATVTQAFGSGTSYLLPAGNYFGLHDNIGSTTSGVVDHWTVDWDNVAVTPEPASLSLLALGALALLRRKNRN